MGLLDRLPPMDHLRSEKMCFVQLIFPAETARLAVTYLGEVGLIQFKDVSAPLPTPRLLLPPSRICLI
jgi:V-type H+-transporting ATPase subunit a